MAVGKGVIDTVCPDCGSALHLETLGGQDGNIYAGACPKGHAWEFIDADDPDFQDDA